MRWRTRPRTEGSQRPEKRRRDWEGARSLFPLALGLLLVVALWVFPSLASYAGIALPLVGLALAVTRLLRRVGALRSILRGFLLVWLAITAAVGVLIAIGGFYREDLVLFAVVLAVLAALRAGDGWLTRRKPRTSSARST